MGGASVCCTHNLYNGVLHLRLKVFVLSYLVLDPYEDQFEKKRKEKKERRVGTG